MHFIFDILEIFLDLLSSRSRDHDLKAIICQEVENNGGVKVKIMDISMASRNEAMTFQVEFEDPNHHLHQTTCMVEPETKQIYWTQCPRELILEN